MVHAFCVQIQRKKRVSLCNVCQKKLSQTHALAATQKKRIIYNINYICIDFMVALVLADFE